MDESSPLVVDHGWGYVEIEKLGRFRDVKLWPGGGRAWDWRETGTDHRPGILPADVTELLDRRPDLVILSCGRQGQLGVSPETVSLLEAHGVSVVREKTDVAMATYNRLAAEGRRVAGLFHSTC
ncbi:MAG: Mth938-like domain-containing protein [Actinomycetes bacterium]